MRSLQNKRILLGLCGGIAAYKSAELCRTLIKAGAEVQVVMTQGAQNFITPMTMQSLSGKQVHTNLMDADAEAAMGHIALARWADLILVAPASASFLARLAQGQASDLLSTLCLARRCPIAVAPAMNQAMWSDSATQANVETLQNRNILFFGPDDGDQACGDIGPGRLLEPQRIAELVASQFKSGALNGIKVTLTAGPTREAIDPVRFLSNHSSGRMGYALAQALVDAGAAVRLVSGPVSIGTPERLSCIFVESANEMLEAVLADPGQIFIGVAAVADYRPQKTQAQKIKKDAGELSLQLVRNPDILATVAQLKPKPFCVGFAAETENMEIYARAKLENKGLDMIVANNASATFNSNEASLHVLVRKTTQIKEVIFEQASKTLLAKELVTLIAANFPAPASLSN
jgi:phosphopantothenoylcysteine decarboxylase/phosphopantothenate--cysteine ligase